MSCPPSGVSSFYDLVETDADGNSVSFDKFKGKFAAFKEYIPKGLEIVLFPCAQFGGQELSSNGKVLDFATSKEFEGTVMDIGDIVGSNARKSWAFFYEQTGAAEPGWNFKGKFLVGRDGKIKAAGSNLEQEIVDLLAETPEL